MAIPGQVNPQLPKLPLLKEGYLLKRQRGQSSGADLRGLKFQQRFICLTQDFLGYFVDKKVRCFYRQYILQDCDYYHIMIVAEKKGEKKGEFPVTQMRIIEKVPDNTFQKTFCFQVIIR